MHCIVNNPYTMWKLMHGANNPFNATVAAYDRTSGKLERFVKEHPDRIKEQYDKKKAYNRAYAKRKYENLSEEAKKAKNKRTYARRKAKKQKTDEAPMETPPDLTEYIPYIKKVWNLPLVYTMHKDVIDEMYKAFGHEVSWHWWQQTVKDYKDKFEPATKQPDIRDQLGW